MRIIQKGKMPLPLKEKRKKCSNCGTIMAYTEGDICINMNYDEYVECPLCSEKLYVSIFDRRIRNER